MAQNDQACMTPSWKLRGSPSNLREMVNEGREPIPSSA